jgi:hypothetical protein
MSDNQLDKELIYRPRWLVPLVREAIANHPVVIVTGARQVGKSTLLRHELPARRWRYVTLDNFDDLRQAQEAPEALWAGTDHIIIDEVQRAPGVLSAIKRAVDERGRRIRFVLSGSANLLLMTKVSESLAGRAVYFDLLPMTLGEMASLEAPDIIERLFKGRWPREGAAFPQIDPAGQILRGLLPPLIEMKAGRPVSQWWDGYVATYLERDLRQFARIDALVDFRRLMETLALRGGQILNQSEVSRDIALPQATVNRYVNILEASCVAFRLPAFARNRTKRLIKSPKFYWFDPGLAAHLAGYHDIDSMRKAREYGGFIETLVLLHLRALAQLSFPRTRIHYWRTVSGQEVDFVLERGKSLVAFEVKASSEARHSDCDNLRLFLKEYPEAVCGVLLYGGRDIRIMDDKIVAIPWTALFMRQDIFENRGDSASENVVK